MRWIIIIINLIFILILRDRLVKQIALPTHEEQESLARPAQAYTGVGVGQYRGVTSTTPTTITSS